MKRGVFPSPGFKTNLLKRKHLVGLRFGWARRSKKMLKMKVDPDISMKTKDGENPRQVDPDMLVKTS